MKRELLKQMRNEWRDNVWMLVELAVVGLAIWMLVSIVFIMTRPLTVAKGFNADDVYSLTLKYVNADSPEYIDPGEEGKGHYSSDRMDLISRLRSNPYVESVGSHQNGLPYNYNNHGNALRAVGSNDSVFYTGNMRIMSPDMATVVQLESVTGKTPEQLAEMLRRGELLISEQEDYEGNGRKVSDLLGKEVMFYGDSTKSYRVGDIIKVVRRNDFELSYGTIVLPAADTEWMEGVAVRVKPGMGEKFKESFRTDKSLQRQRNIYLSDLHSLQDIGKGNMHELYSQMNMWYILLGFLLVTIFLGLLGTFWFRIQQRVSEIAIRKVSGAKKSQIFARVMTEGMVLLLVAMLIVSAVVWPFTEDIENIIGIKWPEMLATEAATILIIAIGIFLSLWYPAAKAMRVEPAIAIKEE